METDNKLASGIENVIKANIGVSIELFKTLYIRQLDDLQLAVGITDIYTDEIVWERVFDQDDMQKAIWFFIKKRNVLKLGFDYEAEREKCEELELEDRLF